MVKELQMDLYKAELLDDAWIGLCGGNTGDQSGNDTESCVEMAAIPNADGFAIRDSKNRDAGVLRFSVAELDAFVASYRGSR
ncbi:uncharacterized protein DUF397 [Herbihabitans rhizosphaerae]|uniref:Uncharacterized protein DUF397 n=1 Tax=Herbihabitans rhizosphaerae TaxID=1872711 RepID=A0A4Q7KT86_9PSEU|nr:DUF397 domain-containing protein [Herbihabitans rhizosphaerae]RZS39011.1 uncharacterized protein DUF397 [Herbihabitans rhizosphaerae]